MTCPYCNSPTKVTNSRSHNKMQGVWRRRACKSCGAVWTTKEHIDLTTSHRVITDDSHLEPFSRDKLFLSIKDSCVHRKTALEDASALTDTVLSLVLRFKQSQIPLKTIMQITQQTLQRFDTVAGAVYNARYL